MDEQLKMIEDFFTAKGVDTATVQAIKDQSKVGFKLYSKKKIKKSAQFPKFEIFIFFSEKTLKPSIAIPQ